MRKLVLMCVVACFMAGACGRGEYQDMLDKAEAVMSSRPDSSIMLLETWADASVEFSDKLKARYALLYSIALDKNYIDLTSDSIISPAVTYYECHGSIEDKLLMKYYLGRIRYNAGNYSNAIVLFEEAAELVAKTDNDLMAGLIYRSMMLCHAMIYNYQESIRYGRLAHDAFVSAGESRYVDYMMLSLGNMYFCLKDFDEAKQMFVGSFNKGNRVNDTNLIVRSLEGYALALKLENPEDCLQVMTQIVEYIEDSLHMEPSPQVLANYAVAHAEHGNRAKANKFLQMAKEGKIVSADDSLNVGFADYQIQRLIGNCEGAVDILEDLFLSQDKNSREALSQSVLSAQRDYFEQNALFHRYRTNVLCAVVVLGSIFFVLIIILVCYMAWANLRQRDAVISRTVSQMEELQRDYKNSLEYANEFTSRINALYSTRYNYMNAICEEYYSHSETARNRHILQIVDGMVSKLSEDNEYDTLRDIVNHYYDGIMVRVENECPTMKHDEMRLLCYLIANFSSVSISLFLGISIDNVYTRKRRLKARISSFSEPLRGHLLGHLI